MQLIGLKLAGMIMVFNRALHFRKTGIGIGSRSSHVRFLARAGKNLHGITENFTQNTGGSWH